MTTQPLSFEEQLRAEHRARQRRMAGKVNTVQKARAPGEKSAEAPLPAPDKEPTYRPIFSTSLPLWWTEKLRFDAHEIDRREWFREGRKLASSPTRLYIRDRAADLGFKFKAITGPSRAVTITLCRHVIIWEVKKLVSPTISLPELGRIFKRDHTTILHAIRRIDQLKQLGKLPAHTIQALHAEEAASKHAGPVLAFLKAFTAENGRAPSADQIAKHMGWSSTASVYTALELLETRRKIKRESRKVHELTLV